jgi:hypothetical protein
MILTALLVVGIAAVLTPLIRRDLKIAVRRRRSRRFWPALAGLVALMPAIRESVRHAAEFEQAMTRVQAQFGAEAIRAWARHGGGKS